VGENQASKPAQKRGELHMGEGHFVTQNEADARKTLGKNAQPIRLYEAMSDYYRKNERNRHILLPFSRVGGFIWL
jgi:hypothetical protein